MEQSNIVRNFKQQLPVSHQDRKSTDRFCTIISSLFAITMFVLACLYLNAKAINRWRYPTDSAAKTCGHQHVDFPYLYFASVNDPSQRLCLSHCPQIDDQKVHSYQTICKDCILQSNNVDIYNTMPSHTLIGKFCLPTDQRIKQNIVQKSGLQDRYRVVESYKSIAYSMLFALVIGIVFMLLVQIIPQKMLQISIFAGTTSIIILGILLLFLKSQAFPKVAVFRYFLGSLCLLFGALILSMFFIKKKQIKVIGMFLKEASNDIKSNLKDCLVIPLFLFLIIIILGVGIFQYFAFFSMGQIYHTGFSPFYQMKTTFGSGFLNFLNIVQIFWGLNFLRQSSFYIISGYTISFYTGKQINPIKDLILKHWGSVVACAFMVGFFGILDTVYLLLCPDNKTQNACAKVFSKILLPFQSLSRFVREQAMPYINLTGIPYCNSSDYCQYLTQQSPLTKGQGHRPLIRYYRYASYTFLTSLVLIFCVIYQHKAIGTASFLSILSVGILGLFIVGRFVDIHADKAAAILLTYMLQSELASDGLDRLTTKGQDIRNKLQEFLN